MLPRNQNSADSFVLNKGGKPKVTALTGKHKGQSLIVKALESPYKNTQDSQDQQFQLCDSI